MQHVSTPFADITTASVQKPRASVRISWLRRSNTLTSFAEVGASLVDGSDIIQGEFSAITPADLYEYFNEDDRLLKLRIDRSLNEPVGGISYAKAFVILENTDNRFTPDWNSTIGTSILPKRPIILSLGYEVNNTTRLVPQFKGLLESRPRQDYITYQTELEAFDYISYLDQYPLESAMYVDYRGDQLILAILQQAGFNDTQYDLDESLNTVSFAWFQKGDIAGNIIRKICEAEEAHFFQDENGKLIFQNRRTYISAPFTDIQHTVDSSDIIDWQDMSNNLIINRCEVRANPREVQDTTEIYRLAIFQPVAAGETYTFWAQFADPVYAFSTPVATTDYLANTLSDGTGSNLTSDFAIVVTNFATTSMIEVTNNSASNGYLTYFRMLGQAAIMRPTEGIRQIYEDDDAVNKYGETKNYVIVNDFIDSEPFAYYLSRAVVRKYKDNVRRIKITVTGIPQLQLKDKVSVQDINTGAYTSWRIMEISSQISGPSFLQVLSLREILDTESDGPAIVGTSLVDGEDVVWTC